MPKQTKKQNRKMKTRKTKKRHDRKQKGGNKEDELNMMVHKSLEVFKKSVDDYLNAGGDINKQGRKGITALMEATYLLSIPKINYLLEHGADVNVVADNGTTAYSYAYGNNKIVNILKDAGAITDPTYLLLLAIRANNDASAKAMIDNRDAIDLDIDKNTFYRTKKLREDGINYKIYEYPLNLAILMGKNEIVKDLLDAGADLNIESDYLSSDMLDSDEEILLEEDGENPLLLAVRFSDEDIVRIILEENIAPDRGQEKRLDINAISYIHEHSALQVAVANEEAEKVKLLVDAGANVNIRTVDDIENTPLILAAYNGNLEIVKILVEGGADVDLTNNEGVTAVVASIYENDSLDILEYFSEQGHMGAARLLLSISDHKEPEKKDTTVVVRQILPTPIKHQPQDKPIPEILHNPKLTFYDVIDMEEKSVQAFLDEDPDNIIFVYKKQIIGTNRQQLYREFTTNRTKIMLECKESNTYFHQPEENLVKDNENTLLYYLNMDIVGLLGILLPISQLKSLTTIVHVVQPDTPPYKPMTPDTPPETPPYPPNTPPYEPMTPDTTPPSPHFGEDISPIRGGNLFANVFVVDTSEDPKVARAITSFGAYDGDNVVSAKHCAEEEPMKIGKLYSVDFPLRKKPVKRTRSKSPKNKTRKVRKQPKSP